MKTATHEINGITILSISGNIAQESVAVFRNRFSDLIERKKLKIILDLGDAAYISSMCLAIIVESKNKLTQVHGELKITVSKG